MAGVAEQRGYSSGSCSAASVACAAFRFSSSGLYVLRCVRNHACVRLELQEILRCLIAHKKSETVIPDTYLASREKVADDLVKIKSYAGIIA